MLQAIRQRDLSRVVSQIKLRPVRRLGKAQVKLSGCRPKQPCRFEPFFYNAISRDKSVHEPIVRGPAHPRRLVGVLVTPALVISVVAVVVVTRPNALPAPRGRLPTPTRA